MWRASPVEDIAWVRFDDEYVAYHRPSGKTHFLNAATHRLLTDLLVEPASVATVAIGELNLISVTFAVSFIGLSVDFGIHFALRYREAADGGAERLR